MNNEEGKMNPREIKIQGLLDSYLRNTPLGNGFEEKDHLDEDTVTAFVEGNLSEREAKPVTSHLVGCSYCRHITAEMIKLDLAFAEDTRTPEVSNAEPARVSEVLNGILSRIFGTSDGAVFAHEEKEDEEAKEEDEEE